MKKGKKPKTIEELTAGLEELLKGKELREDGAEMFDRVIKNLVSTPYEKPVKKKRLPPTPEELRERHEELMKGNELREDGKEVFERFFKKVVEGKRARKNKK